MSLIFSSDRGNPLVFRLWRIPVSGAEPEALGIGEEGALDPTISADGRRLAFQKSLSDVNIWRVAGPRGEGPLKPSRWIASTRTDHFPAFSRDGT